jgi:hypothetical protein
MLAYSDRGATLKWRIFARPLRGWLRMAPEGVDWLARSPATRFAILLFKNHFGLNAANC